MKRSDVLVEVRDRNLVRKGTITPKYLRMKATLRHNSVGQWKITLPGSHPMVPYLSAEGSGIIVTLRGTPRFSGPTDSPQRVRDRVNPDGTFTFTGVTDSILLADARAWPQPSNSDVSTQNVANDTRTGNAETVMRAYVNANIGPGAPAGRKPAGSFRTAITLATNLNRGVTVTKSPRFQVLIELLSEIATYAGLGFQLVQVGSAIEFQVLTVNDRSATVRLDIENGTLTSEQVQVSAPVLTRAIVAGQGEGTARQIIQRTTADSLAAETAWGRVIEQFFDQRDTNVTTELNQAGDEALFDGGFTSTAVKVIPSDDQTMLYGVDWLEGDKITVIVNGQETTTTVTAAALIVDEKAVAVGAAIGDVTGFRKEDALTKRVEDTEKAVESLQRTLEVPDSWAISDITGLATALAGKAALVHTHAQSDITGLVAALAALVEPAGTIKPYAGASAPAGYLLCDGSSVSRTTYADLFAVCGTQFGGSGSTFNVPNLKGRTVVGIDTAQTEFDVRGETGGAKTHTLITGEMPAHTHGPPTAGIDFLVSNHTAGTANGSGSAALTNYATVTGSTGGGGAHNNLQPYIALNYIIKT